MIFLFVRDKIGIINETLYSHYRNTLNECVYFSSRHISSALGIRSNSWVVLDSIRVTCGWKIPYVADPTIRVSINSTVTESH